MALPSAGGTATSKTATATTEAAATKATAATATHHAASNQATKERTATAATAHTAKEREADNNEKQDGQGGMRPVFTTGRLGLGHGQRLSPEYLNHCFGSIHNAGGEITGAESGRNNLIDDGG